MRTLSLALTLGALSACAPKGEPAEARPPSAPAAPTGSAAMEFPAAPASATATTPPSPPTPPTPFHLVSRGEHALHAMGSRIWVETLGDGLAFAELRGEALVRDEALAHGIERCDAMELLGVVFTSATDAWTLEDFHPWSACPPPARLFHRIRDRFRLVGPIDAHWIALAPWVGGSTLVAEVPMRSGPPWGYTLRTLGAGKAPTPRRSGPHPHAEGGCWTELDWPLALFASQSGEAVVIGVSQCKPPEATENDVSDDEPELFAVAERLQVGRQSRIELLPVELGSDSIVVGSGPRSIWTVGTASDGGTALVFGDDRGFSIVEPVDPSTILLSATEGGALWAEHDGTLRRRDPSGLWTTVTLPDDAGAVLDVHETSADDVWLVTDAGLYRTRPMPPYEPPRRECTDAERAREERARSAGSKARRGSKKITETPQPPHGCSRSVPPRAVPRAVEW